MRYEVTGSHAVRGNAPGSFFEHNFPPEQEARLIAAGRIARRPSKSPAAPPMTQGIKPPRAGAKTTDDKETS
jgi:hypothetical protein